MSKQTVKAAGEYAVLQVTADLLEVDPEIADEYVYSFAKEWGREAIKAMVRCMERTLEFDMSETLRETLQHDLFLKKESGEPLMCERW